MPNVCQPASLGSVPLLAVAVLALFLAMPAAAVAAEPVAKSRVAVLDFHDSSGGALTPQETQYLADVVRGTARRVLPSGAFILMTRENILDLLPPGRSLDDCAGDCAVETGRNLGARYVVTGEATVFDGQLRLTMQLYDTVEGNLLGQRIVRSPDVGGLDPHLEREAPILLLTLRGGQRGDSDRPTEGRLGGAGEAWTADGAADVVVDFESDPPGALVEIDGRPVGETPCSRPLAPGLYQVGIKKVRYVPHHRVLDVKAGLSDVMVTLTPDFGWLTVTSEPPGLGVTIDGRPAGATPLSRLVVDVGAHDVLVVSPEYHDEGRRVVLERGEHEVVAVSPVPRNGGVKVLALDVDGNAATGRVLIDGVDVGTTYAPLTVLMGSRQIEVRGEAGNWSGEVTVVERELTEVQALLVGGVRRNSRERTRLGLTMISIVAGSFTMGTPTDEPGRRGDEPQRHVTLTGSFMMSATEVTQAQYEAVMAANPSEFEGCSRPVEQVTWFDAVGFCNALSEREGLVPAYRVDGDGVAWDRTATGYRLPTEAEWEYACRAETTTRFHAGDGDRDLARAGWYSGNSGQESHDVAMREPNAWGLYDMHGNVWEWCWDWYGPPSVGRASDPIGPATGSGRILRGGSWRNDARSCRSGNRVRFDPDLAHGNIGFRVVRGPAR